jgi:T1SS-143 domain-containing protein
MSIEDPRLSSIDNTSAADDFDTAVEQHLGFAREAVDGIEVAQAETPEAGRTDRLPSQTPVQTAAAVIPTEVTPNAENVVTLPAGIELDNLEFEVDGENLILVLADGTEIVVVGGAANIPTFLIGDVELPQVALFAALEDSNINVAAGPDGTFSAQATPDTSRNFEDDPIDAGPEDFALADLLGDTAFGDELRTGTIEGDDGEPTILNPLTESFVYDEAVIADSDTDNQIIEGTLPFEPGPDFGTITRINFVGASNVDEGDGSVLPGFTSGGRQITVTSFAAPADGNIKVFEAIQAVDSEGNVVFTLSVNRETGEFTFELIGQLEHPDAGADGSQDDMDDLLRLAFTYTVTDLDGDSVTGSFNIDVMDDAPTFGDAEDGAVDEDHLWNGNPDDEGEGEEDIDDLPPGPETASEADQYEVYRAEAIKGEYPSVGGSLGINWGADKGNAIADGGLTETTNDRGVGFTRADIEKLEDQNLTSDGVALFYVPSNNGTTLTAYKVSDYYGDKRVLAAIADGGSEGVIIVEDGEGEYYGEPVFSVSLSDDGAGSYQFTLYGNLDHVPTKTDEDPGQGSDEGSEELRLLSTEAVEEDRSITFHFTVKDSDGDTAGSTFTVDVNDDSPIFDAQPESVSLDEEDVAALNGNSGDSYGEDDDLTPGEDDGYDNGTGGRSAYGDLNISWGSDDGNNGSGGLGDRSVRFTGIGSGEGFGTGSAIEVFQSDSETSSELTHNGETVRMWLSSDGTTILGYVGELGEGAEPDQSQVVFSIELSDYGSGSYVFTLFQSLDHAFEGREDDIRITFQVEATDGDFDSTSASFSVDIDDDAPVIGKPVATTVEDEKAANGNDENDGLYGSATGSLAISWGSDNGNNGSGTLGDRSVGFASATVAISGGLDGKFTSLGEPVSTTILEDGTLVAYTGSVAPTALSGEGSANIVFYVSLSDEGTDGAGSYSFTLVKPLDHADDGTNSENSLDLTFSFEATDSDGDTVESSFTVTVVDDKPELAKVKPIVEVANEDDISTIGSAHAGESLGTSPNDGNGDGTFTGNPPSEATGPAFLSGSLSSLVKVGADNKVTFSFVDTAVVIETLSELGLSSKGQSLSYAVKDGVLYAFDNYGQSGDTDYQADAGDRLVFSLTIKSDGTYEFSLHDQLDHDAPGDDWRERPTDADQNEDLQDTIQGDVTAIDFGSLIQATDNDGDSVVLKDAFSIKIRDDVPELSGAKESRTVDEDDIKTSQSTGTSPGDRDGDGSWTGGSGQNGNGGAFIDGSLAKLVKGGADDTVKFSFIDGRDVSRIMGSLGLSSKGAELSYEVKNGVLYAYDNGDCNASFSEGDRLVFTLTLKDNGSYTFELVDQLDHDYGQGQNTDLQDDFWYKDVEAIDFGSIIKATDYDGDSVSLGGAFKIEIRDDVPELSGQTEARTIDEDDIRTGLSTGTSPNDGPADQSYTGGPSNNQPGPAYIAGSVANLVKGGADDALEFSFTSNAASILRALGLKSQGDLLSYEVRGNVLYAFENQDGRTGYSSKDRIVFQLTLDKDGDYKFELFDQLDHVKPAEGADENTVLQPGVVSINFGDVIQAEDFDGDSIKLGEAFSIKVRDDIPELTGKTVKMTVNEDDIDTSQSLGTSPGDGNADGSYTGGKNQNGVGPAYVEGTVAGLIKGGSDEGTTFAFSSTAASVMKQLGLTSAGASLSFEVKGNVLYGFEDKAGNTGFGEGDRAVFKLTLKSDGSFTFELIDQLDHVKPAEGADENLVLQPGVTAISFGDVINAIDYDGDKVALGKAFSIEIVDDIPVAKQVEASRVLDDEAQDLFEANEGSNLPWDWSDASPDRSTVSGSAGALFAAGADGVKSVSIVGPALAVVFMDDQGFAHTETVTWGAGTPGEGGSTIFTATSTHYANGAAVLKIGADGSYSFTMKAPLAHAEQNALEQLQGEEEATLNFTFTVVDGDGDKATGSLSIKVDDDTPEPLFNIVSAPAVLDDEAQSEFRPVNPTGSGDVNEDVKTVSGCAGSLFKMGADGLSDIAVELPFFTVIAKAANGFAAIELVEWSEGVRSADGKTTFTATIGSGETTQVVAELVIGADGSYDFRLDAPVVHTVSSTKEDNTDLVFGYVVTDGDGDQAIGALKISVDDDTPVAKVVLAEAVTLENSALSEDTTATGAAGSLFTAGADGVQSVSINSGAFSVIYKQAGNVLSEAIKWGDGVPSAGGITTFIAKGVTSGQDAAVLKIFADGSYSFELKAPLSGWTGGEDEKTISIGFEVTDGDGDKASGSLSIPVENIETGVPTDIRFTGNIDLELEMRSGGPRGFNGGRLPYLDHDESLFTMEGTDPDVDTLKYSFDGKTETDITYKPYSSEDTVTLEVKSTDGVVNPEEGMVAGLKVLRLTITSSTVSDGDHVYKESMDLALGTDSGEKIDGSSVARDQVIYGFDGNDTISGGAGDDWIKGGDGFDRMTGGAGQDIFAFKGGDSETSPKTESSGRFTYVKSVDGYDIVTDFKAVEDKLEFEKQAKVVKDTGMKSGEASDFIWVSSNPGSTLISVPITAHSIKNGIVTFYHRSGVEVAIDTQAKLGAAVQYLDRNSMGQDGGVIAFNAVMSGIKTTFVFQEIHNNSSAEYTLVALENFVTTDFNALIVDKVVDPIVLDLDHNGFAFSSIGDGVTFDIDADGKADQIAWTSDDGILAYDVDGDGVIDNGSELFTPDFNGGKFASGVAALASLDSNGDGKIDADDEAFSKLQIWIDADNDGISDDGELSSLTDHHVSSISLTADTTGGSEDGQTIFAEGEFTFEDGSTGNFVEVGFDAVFGSDDAFTVSGTDGDDILHGGMGQVTMTGGAGADTFVFDGTALDDLDVADVITDFNADEGDALDVSALLDSLLGEQATAETAAASIKATVADGNTTVSVQTGDDTWKDVVVLQNHDTAIKVLFDDKHSVTVTHD